MFYCKVKLTYGSCHHTKGTFLKKCSNTFAHNNGVHNNHTTVVTATLESQQLSHYSCQHCYGVYKYYITNICNITKSATLKPQLSATTFCYHKTVFPKLQSLQLGHYWACYITELHFSTE